LDLGDQKKQQKNKSEALGQVGGLLSIRTRRHIGKIVFEGEIQYHPRVRKWAQLRGSLQKAGRGLNEGDGNRVGEKPRKKATIGLDQERKDLREHEMMKQLSGGMKNRLGSRI